MGPCVINFDPTISLLSFCCRFIEDLLTSTALPYRQFSPHRQRKFIRDRYGTTRINARCSNAAPLGVHCYSHYCWVAVWGLQRTIFDIGAAWPISRSHCDAYLDFIWRGCGRIYRGRSKWAGKSRRNDDGT